MEQREFESERQEFIEEHRAELAETERELNRLEARLAHEARYVEASERAEWSHEVFELKQEQQRLQAELSRAQSADDAEWREMRGDFKSTIDSFQAAVSKVGGEISSAIGGDSEQALVGADSGLCPLQVSGADVSVDEKGDELVVEVTTDNAQAVSTLQRQARTVAQRKEYRPATMVNDKSMTNQETKNQRSTSPDPQRQPQTMREQPKPIAIKSVDVENLPEGVRLVFNPQEGSKDELRERLEQDTESLKNGRCENNESRQRRSAM